MDTRTWIFVGLLASSLLWASTACAQTGRSSATARSPRSGVVVGSGIGFGYAGAYPFYPGVGFGYFPSRIGDFWSNGYSLYGPPVPTYGPIPGSFGGSQQRFHGVAPYFAPFPQRHIQRKRRRYGKGSVSPISVYPPEVYPH